jgi:hypothetical protein
VYVTENFEIKNLTVEEFNKGAIPFKTYIEVLTKFCLGET